jgi:hypothetical protein
MAVSVGIFGAFLLMAVIFGFFLWQTLFVSEEYGGREEQGKPAYSEQHTGHENTGGAGSPLSAGKSATDEAIAEYTKWLAIFTMFLVLATLGLFISGERNVDVARKTANAAISQAKAAGDANVAATKALQQSQRPWVVAEAIRLIKPISEVDGRYEIFFNLYLKNTGNSVATDVFPVMRIEENLVATLESNWNKTDADLRDKKEFIVKPSKWPLGIVLAPGQSIPQPFGFGGPIKSPGYPSTEKVRTGTFYLIGLIEYKDQFGITHKTRFAFNPRGDSVNPWDGDTFVVSGGMQEAD